ncbi:hypothetical protein BHM03_00014044 [Ensete ventricosum]|nr:hypothetical protein BHM03_00014044 [Ensete ventricosum]
MTRKNIMTCNIKSKTSSGADTCVGMSVTNPYSPIADPLETRRPVPKVGKRPTYDEDLDITFKSGGDEYPCHDDVNWDLVTLTSTLTGFIGDFVSPMGATTIPVTFGGEPRSKTLMVSFMVVKLPSAYNAIIGRPTLNRLKAVISTYHRLLKFPT